MKKIFTLMICFWALGGGASAWGQEADSAGTTGTAVRDLDIEKLNLEIERLKLENERLQLQIKSLQMETPSVKTEEKKEDKKESKAEKKLAADMALKSEELAKQDAADEKKVVLDFTNGEIWYKGMRNKINDFYALCKDQNWNVKPEFIKYDQNGDSKMMYAHQNMELDKYDSQSRGVFIFKLGADPEDFSYVTPEGITDTSSLAEIRNRFETEYFTFDKEYTDKGFRVLRFKHGAGFLGFDDVLEFWFDQKDVFKEVKWGMLDKK